MIIGYGRTSTTDQTAGLAAQERDLKAAGAAKLFTEQVSSVAQRAKLNECLAFLREGDVLMVTKPDRLARSTAELLAIEADLYGSRGLSRPVLHAPEVPHLSQAGAEAAPADLPGRIRAGGVRCLTPTR